MATLVSRLLDLADEQVRMHPRSSAIRRRAVSTAYYAAFHALMKCCADALLTEERRASPDYARVYRAIDHGPLKNAFQAKGSPLRQSETLKKIGDLIVPLQSARMKADYEPPRIGFYDENQAREFLAQARQIVDLVIGLAPDEAVTLAVHLIIKDRK